VIRVGFVFSFSDENWLGGFYYFKGLLEAILALPDRKIEPVIVTGQRAVQKYLDDLPAVEVVRSSLLDRKHLAWVMRGAYWWVSGHDLFLERLLLQHNIAILSHAGCVGARSKIPTIGWIPDFQHLHLPEMFSTREIRKRSRCFRGLVIHSCRVILSSQDALSDLRGFAPTAEHKARVLQFVAKPNPGVETVPDKGKLEEQYDFTGPFFYLPNQFWKHKNHDVVVKAVSILKAKRRKILILCSGYEGGYRRRSHFAKLKSDIHGHCLENNIRLLGVIDRADMLGLMRQCLSVINPSLFEGWSTTVEEAKSLGKQVILSDIGVHREQNPPEAHYFDPRNAEELAEILWVRWTTGPSGPDLSKEQVAHRCYEVRRMQYAEQYQRIVMEVGSG
jgi:glycosyltransferase involved in cell wall biosynthesis